MNTLLGINHYIISDITAYMIHGYNPFRKNEEVLKISKSTHRKEIHIQKTINILGKGS